MLILSHHLDHFLHSFLALVSLENAELVDIFTHEAVQGSISEGSVARSVMARERAVLESSSHMPSKVASTGTSEH